MTDSGKERGMKVPLAVTASVGVALNVVAFLFALKPSALWQLPGILLFFVVVATALVDLICVAASRNQYRFRAFIPFCVAILCLSGLVPSLVAGSLLRDHRFRSHLDQYEAVIAMMMDGSISVNEKMHRVELPREYAHLAVATLAEKDSNGVLTVEFIISGGFPVKHSGYLYRSEGTLEDWRRADRWPARTRMGEHWYKISD